MKNVEDDVNVALKVVIKAVMILALNRQRAIDTEKETVSSEKRQFRKLKSQLIRS